MYPINTSFLSKSEKKNIAPGALRKDLNMPALVTAICLVLFLSAAQARQGLVINEFMADNNGFLADTSDQKFEDWIEIYNSGTASIDLNARFLTDDPSFPAQWPFPEITISPGGYLLIWADNDSLAAGLHANFKLRKEGEFLGIYSVSGQDTFVVDSLSFGPQATNLSFGRFPDGASDWQTFVLPTPGKSNSADACIDSSAIIFDDTQVRNYELHFYHADWTDSLEYYYENGEEYIPAQWSYQGMVLDSIGVRYKGNSSYMISRSTHKKPLKVRFNKFKKNQTFYGVRELNFSNCVKDPSFMREKIAYDIARQYMPASRAAYANIYAEGELLGLYVQVEQVDKTFLARHFDDNGGNLYKASNNGTTLEYLGTDQSRYEAGIELKTNEDENDWSGLIAMLDKLANTPLADFSQSMESSLNLDLCCRFLAFNMVLSNFDSYTGSGRNFYLYDDSTSGQFQILPWDLNEAFGAYTYDWNVLTADIVQVSNLGKRPLNRRILENDELRKKYLGYIAEMISGPASYDSLETKVGRIKTVIADHVLADENKLYSNEQFLTNVENNVTIDMGVSVPGLLSFSKLRNSNLETQLAKYSDTAVAQDISLLQAFALYQNYPNPFNLGTKISFSLPKDSHVKLEIFNILGEHVLTLMDERRAAGTHSVFFDGANLAGGLYLYKMKTGDFSDVRTLALVK
jgi:spore coat protein CotH